MTEELDTTTQTADYEAYEQTLREANDFILRKQLDEMYREELRQKIEPYTLRADHQLPPLKPVVKRGEVLICSEGNISAVVGEAKSKKTFLCTAIVGSMLEWGGSQQFGIERRLCRVLWVDTEQSKEHIQKVLFRINLLTHVKITSSLPHILMQTLREESPKDRLQLLRYAIEYQKPKLVVVDGVSDLLTNTNNLEESEALVAELLTLSTIYSCHIMCVLHTNPNSDKARGHLGSTLMRKAETVLFVHRVGDISIVEPQYCRNMPFERFAFCVDEVEDASSLGPQAVGLGLPVECDLPSVGSEQEDDCVRILRNELGGSAERKLLTTKVEQVLGVTHGYAKVKVTRAIQRGMLKLCDADVVMLP
ncbi:MAG: AAA family ATPase [Alistipes sp.]|nr:AAA family ATPase [Alistipes sp.]